MGKHFGMLVAGVIFLSMASISQAQPIPGVTTYGGYAGPGVVRSYIPGPVTTYSQTTVVLQQQEFDAFMLGMPSLVM